MLPKWRHEKKQIKRWNERRENGGQEDQKDRETDTENRKCKMVENDMGENDERNNKEQKDRSGLTANEKKNRTRYRRKNYKYLLYEKTRKKDGKKCKKGRLQGMEKSY